MNINRERFSWNHKRIGAKRVFKYLMAYKPVLRDGKRPTMLVAVNLKASLFVLDITRAKSSLGYVRWVRKDDAILFSSKSRLDIIPLQSKFVFSKKTPFRAVLEQNSWRCGSPPGLL